MPKFVFFQSHFITATVVSALLMGCGPSRNSQSQPGQAGKAADQMMANGQVRCFGDYTIVGAKNVMFDKTLKLNTDGEIFNFDLFQAGDFKVSVSVGHQATDERKLQLTISKSEASGSVSSSGLLGTPVYFDENRARNLGANIHINCDVVKN